MHPLHHLCKSGPEIPAQLYFSQTHAEMFLSSLADQGCINVNKDCSGDIKIA